MIQIREIADKSTWEKFNLASRKPSFLQSWAWGQFQRVLGREFYRLGLYDNRELVGISLIYAETAKIGSYLYCPAGPIFKNLDQEQLTKWVKFVTDIAKGKNHVFLRIDPREIEDKNEKMFRRFGFNPAPEYTQPQCSVTIDLTKNEDGLRSAMSSSTRYNVNAAGRKGVRVREGESTEIGIFLKLLKQTASRKKFVLPTLKDYPKKQFEALEKEGLMKLYVAESGKTPLSAVLVVSYASTAYYLHAANSLEKKELRASYPLVWHTITDAKKAGLTTFDFWGVAPNDDPKHPWAGVTDFKLSFGSEKICYKPAYDLPFNSTYQLMKVVEVWRKPVRKILRFGR